nr:MAG TPA: hypothetical protein [Caudoviricetes sp.]
MSLLLAIGSFSLVLTYFLHYKSFLYKCTTFKTKEFYKCYFTPYPIAFTVTFSYSVNFL